MNSPSGKSKLAEWGKGVWGVFTLGFLQNYVKSEASLPVGLRKQREKSLQVVSTCTGCLERDRLLNIAALKQHLSEKTDEAGHLYQLLYTPLPVLMECDF